MVGHFFDIGRVELTDDSHPGQQVVVPDDRGQAQMPSGLSLDGIAFSRHDDDLHLAWPKGEEVTIAGFFAEDQLADLVFPEGMRLAGGVAAQFAEPLTPEGAPAIARVLAVKGSADVVRQDKRLEAAVGVEILPGDVFEVREDASVAIGFPERAVVAAGGGSRFAVQVVDAHSVSMIHGSMVLADMGKKTDLMLDTPLCTVRPQDCRGGVDITDGRTATIVHLGGKGEVAVGNGRGGCTLKEVEHFTKVASYDQEPSSVGRMDRETARGLFGGALDLFPSPGKPPKAPPGEKAGGVSAKLTPKPKAKAPPKPAAPAPEAKAPTAPLPEAKAPPAPLPEAKAEAVAVPTPVPEPTPAEPEVKIAPVAKPKTADEAEAPAGEAAKPEIAPPTVGKAKATVKRKDRRKSKEDRRRAEHEDDSDRRRERRKRREDRRHDKRKKGSRDKEEAAEAGASTTPEPEKTKPARVAKFAPVTKPAKPAGAAKSSDERASGDGKPKETAAPVKAPPVKAPPPPGSPPSEEDVPEGWTGHFMVGDLENAWHGGSGTDFLYGGEGDGRLVGGPPDGAAVRRREKPDQEEEDEERQGERVILR